MSSDQDSANFKLSQPCPADFETLGGCGRVRHCGLCQKPIYDLSGLTQDEAQALLQRSEGKPADQLYVRRDGTLTTTPCQVGTHLARRRARSKVAFLAKVAAVLVAGAGASVQYHHQSELRQRRQLEKWAGISLADDRAYRYVRHLHDHLASPGDEMPPEFRRQVELLARRAHWYRDLNETDSSDAVAQTSQPPR